MYLTGFADEAARDLDGQIAATKALDWTNIEARGIDGVNLTDITDVAFDEVCRKLDAAGVTINSFGSAIANWGKAVDKETTCLAEAKRAIPRMKRIGTKLIRIMSYSILPNRGPFDQMEEERFRRLRDITAIFLDNGLTPVHENCNSYGGMSWEHALRLAEAVPDLKMVFDTGNPVFSDDWRHHAPRPKQSAWEFYEHTRDLIAYVHIKDGIWSHVENKVTYVFPGEGEANVREIVTDLLIRGYDGGFSMEPHMHVVHHEGASAEAKAEAMRANYVEYGRRFMALLRDCRKAARQETLAVV